MCVCIVCVCVCMCVCAGSEWEPKHTHVYSCSSVLTAQANASHYLSQRWAIKWKYMRMRWQTERKNFTSLLDIMRVMFIGWQRCIVNNWTMLHGVVTRYASSILQCRYLPNMCGWLVYVASCCIMYHAVAAIEIVYSKGYLNHKFSQKKNGVMKVVLFALTWL